jgi:hypothetical protein
MPIYMGFAHRGFNHDQFSFVNGHALLEQDERIIFSSIVSDQITMSSGELYFRTSESRG